MKVLNIVISHFRLHSSMDIAAVKRLFCFFAPRNKNDDFRPCAGIAEPTNESLGR